MAKAQIPPTCLVLGAGASEGYGYPIGTRLINMILEDADSGVLWQEVHPEVRESLAELLDKLRFSAVTSIDAVLGRWPHLSNTGRYVIARQLKKCENIHSMFPPKWGWYHKLFDRLVEAEKESFANEPVSVVTYNYDRSLEAFLRQAFCSRFDVSLQEAQAVVSRVPIVHVHGILGTLDEHEYISSGSADEILAISKKIKIIGEIADPGEGEFCTNDFALAHKLVADAQNIIFLGFGFHPENIRRLRLDKLQMSYKKVFVTNYHWGSHMQAYVNDLMREVGVETLHFPGGYSCDEFFNYGNEVLI